MSIIVYYGTHTATALAEHSGGGRLLPFWLTEPATSTPLNLATRPRTHPRFIERCLLLRLLPLQVFEAAAARCPHSPVQQGRRGTHTPSSLVA